MMKSAWLWVPVIGFCLSLGACENDLGGQNPGTGGGYGVMTANINGQPWAAPDGYMESVPPFGISMRGVQGTQSEMRLSISPYQGPNNYTIDGITTIEYSSGGDYFKAINGQITVTSHSDEWIEGYFQGEFVSQTSSLYLSVSDGQFAIPLY